jgi:hypothetical protein
MNGRRGSFRSEVEAAAAAVLRTRCAIVRLGHVDVRTKRLSLGSGAIVAELTDFQRGVSRPGRLSLVGTMLQDCVEADVRARYQAEVIAPRRRRLRRVLERAQRLDMIDADADLAVAVTRCTGSWYARALAGSAPPRNWPQRTATLVWRALGGTDVTGAG